MENETITKYDYTLRDKIHEGNLTVVYRAQLEETGQPVVVKLLRNPDPGLREMAKLQQEFEFGRELSESAVARPLALQESAGAVGGYLTWSWAGYHVSCAQRLYNCEPCDCNLAPLLTRMGAF